jgi:signal transduction histidine kinase
VDALIVLAAADAALEVALRQDAASAPQSSLWFSVPAAASLALPLLARRRWPFGAPMLVWLLGAAYSFADGRLVGFTAGVTAIGLGAALLLGQLADPVASRAGLVVVLGSSAIIAANQPDAAAGDYIAVPALFGIAWVGGYALRERTLRADAADARAEIAEQRREAAARIAVAEERARIARELHDVVAHAVGVMVLQVGAVRLHLPAEQHDDSEALREVERTGRTALAEMRHLLSALRRDGEQLDLTPQPGLHSLDALVESFRRAGLPVQIDISGAPFRLPPTIDLSAYRILQEGLTNTLKHAHASAAEVSIRYAGDRIQLQVKDDGRGAAANRDPGFGLLGMRERVSIYGGDITTASEPGRGFCLNVCLPCDGMGAESSRVLVKDDG